MKEKGGFFNLSQLFNTLEFGKIKSGLFLNEKGRWEDEK